MISAENWSRKYLDYEFSQPAFLERALTHKSHSAHNNERLEFLGDAVLGVVIAAALYQQEDDADEGTLSRFRSTLVRRETLGEIAMELRLGDMLLLGAGEARTGGHGRESTQADALEAVIGAIYLDGGFEAARAMILRLFAERLRTLPAETELKDPKTLLQEYLQARAEELPTYDVLHEDGPPHARTFTVACALKVLDIYAEGVGTSRRRAEQDAAMQALEKLGYQGG